LNTKCQIRRSCSIDRWLWPPSLHSLFQHRFANSRFRGETWPFAMIGEGRAIHTDSVTTDGAMINVSGRKPPVLRRAVPELTFEGTHQPRPLPCARNAHSRPLFAEISRRHRGSHKEVRQSSDHLRLLAAPDSTDNTDDRRASLVKQRRRVNYRSAGRNYIFDEDHPFAADTSSLDSQAGAIILRFLPHKSSRNPSCQRNSGSDWNSAKL
jgi:hypothetical protein